MGPDNSAALAQAARPYSTDYYMPFPQDNTGDESVPTPLAQRPGVMRNSYFKSAFSGIWSVHTPPSICPSPRSGHFFVSTPDRSKLYIGYGLGKDGALYSDLWCLDMVTMTWKEIPLIGNKVSPRVGTRAVLYGDYAILFGGYCAPVYFGDLHTINVVTGEVRIIETNGPEPPPRSTPLTVVYDNKYYMWGGYNGNYTNTLHVLDIPSRTWTEYPQDIVGRTAIPYIQIDDMVYSYGNSKQGGIIEFDLKNYKLQVVPTTGPEPPSNMMSAGMELVENFIFFMGGKSNAKSSLVYSYDIKKKWWFVFHILPDGETTTMADGTISDIGLFLLPRFYCFALTYYPPKRQLVATLGEPLKDPPPIFIVSIGEALGIIHLRDDMLDCFSRTNQLN